MCVTLLYTIFQRFNSSPLNVTCAFILQWNSLNILMKVGGHPKLPRTLHRASWLTVSKALGWSMKTWYRGMFGSVDFACSFLAKNIMSVVLLPGQKPHCVFLILPVSTHVVSACWVVVWPTPYQQFQVVWFHGDLVPYFWIR